LFELEDLIPGAHPTPTDFRTTTVDRAHGRIERRMLNSSAMRGGYLTGPYLAQAFKLERTFIQTAIGVVVSQVV
jgi:hypothetical protein